jgi:hypothetical protein
VDADTKALIDELNRIRLDDNRSYASLATEIGIDPGALYKILNGRSEPYDRTLHKISRYLDGLPTEQATKPSRKLKGRAA